MAAKHTYHSRRPSSRTRVLRVLESLSKSDSFLNRNFIVAGATHVGAATFLKRCEENNVHTYMQRRIATSLLMRILPVPKPIDFVVTLCGQQLVNFVQSIDQFLIAKVFVIDEVDSKSVIESLINSVSPVTENKLTFNSNYFIYGFDFDTQDPDNPVEEIYSYSSMPNDLRLLFD